MVVKMVDDEERQRRGPKDRAAVDTVPNRD